MCPNPSHPPMCPHTHPRVCNTYIHMCIHVHVHMCMYVLYHIIWYVYMCHVRVVYMCVDLHVCLSLSLSLSLSLHTHPSPCVHVHMSVHGRCAPVHVCGEVGDTAPTCGACACFARGAHASVRLVCHVFVVARVVARPGRVPMPRTPAPCRTTPLRTARRRARQRPSSGPRCPSPSTPRLAGRFAGACCAVPRMAPRRNSCRRRRP